MKIKNILIVILIVSSLISCSVYYNTFYNAKKYFREAKNIKTKDTGHPTSEAISKYNECIKRCGVVLKEHKDSKWVDDALFLLGKAIFYKKRNYFKAIEKFEDLNKFYPESEFIPESKLFLARSYAEVNKYNESYQILQSLTQNPQYKAHHSEAFKLLAEIHHKNDEQGQAIFYLNKILDEYKDSEEFSSAFFLLGKVHFEKENYQKALETFEKLIDKINERKTKMNARYYLTYSLFKLNDYSTALEKINELIDDEYREEEFAKLELLKARILSQSGNHKKAESLFLNIIENYKRKSEITAETAFYLAEMYFKKTHKYEKAIEYYDQVKKEDRESEYVEKAVTRSAVASKILQFKESNHDIKIGSLIQEQFELAEHYLYVLNMPDSALKVYDDVINNYDKFKFEYKNIRDTIKMSLLRNSSLNSQSIDDSIAYYLKNPDSLNAHSQKDSSNIGFTRYLSETDKDSLLMKLINYNDVLTEYQNEYLPFSYFLKTYVYVKIIQDSTKAKKSYQYLKENYPNNIYTTAAEKILNNESIENIDQKLNATLRKYEKIMKEYPQKPQKVLSELDSLLLKADEKLIPKINYTIGHIYYFTLEDSSQAKPYFNKVLDLDPNSKYATQIKKFYQDGNFVKRKQLSEIFSLEEKKESESEVETETTEPDNRQPEKNADSNSNKNQSIKD